MQYASCSERFDQTYAECSKSVKSVLASTSTFLASGIADDVPTGITPKKKSWNVPQSWERTEPREALLEAFRRRKEEPAVVEDLESSTLPQGLPAVASVESIPSVGSHTSVNSLATSQMRMKKPNGGKGYGSKLDMGSGMKEDRDMNMDRVVIPLGEAGGNIPVPMPRRVMK